MPGSKKNNTPTKNDPNQFEDKPEPTMMFDHYS
jgi:hypothetical protein